MTHAKFLTIRQTMVTKDVFKEGMEVLLAKIQGLCSDVSESRAATRIEIAELLARVEGLEHDVKVLKQKQ